MVKKFLLSAVVASSFIPSISFAEESNIEVGGFSMFSQAGVSVAGAQSINNNLTARLQIADWFDYYAKAEVEYQFNNGFYLLGGYRSQKFNDITEDGMFAGVGYEYRFSDKSIFDVAYKAEDVYGGINTLLLQYEYEFSYNWSFKYNYQVHSDISNEQTISIKYKF